MQLYVVCYVTCCVLYVLIVVEYNKCVYCLYTQCIAAHVMQSALAAVLIYKHERECACTLSFTFIQYTTNAS
jgi:hypothetical protein